jgi:nitrite reductase/ring-hydroxylating ferredoxin subunit
MKTKSWRILLVTGSLAVVIGLVIALAACSGGTAPSSTLPPLSSKTSGATATVAKATVAPTWLTPEITETTALVALDEVQTKFNTHFKVALDKGTAYFMAYLYGGKLHVRADICPPCRSVSYTLVKNTLVCDSCGTVFSAPEGKGISGACVNYPKASVPYETVDGKIVMSKVDLTKAFEDTLNPGLP